MRIEATIGIIVTPKPAF